MVDPPEPAWFGCIDLKYSEDGSVRILELGDGHTSGFTGAGAFIPHTFAKLGCPRRTLGAYMDTVLENKILTHDALEDAGLAGLRPRAGVFRRKYDPDLAAGIRAATGGGAVVLKLADRQRGCGVVAVEPEDLDDTLKQLLVPPELSEPPSSPGSSRGQLTEEWVLTARVASGLSGLQEQAAHWRANECPSFLAEALCSSKLVEGPQGQRYDGTLRLGFALEEGKVRLLGSYWKLPDVAADKPKADLTVRIVSHTHGGSGTLACAQADEAAVWVVLEEPLLKVFIVGARNFTVPGLLKRYQCDGLLLATALTRVAAGHIEEDVSKAERTLLLAEQLAADSGEGGALGGCVRSYARRTHGTLAARRSGGPPDWRRAQPFYDQAVEAMPGNAAALYFAGMARLTKGHYSAAGKHFARSVTADCDFACAYSQLATCCLLLGDFCACVEVSEALLKRHNRIAAAYHCIAVALYAQEASDNGRPGSNCNPERRRRAAGALRRAKELQRGKSWGRNEEEMLEALEGKEPLPKRPARTWLFHAWRL